ncbi:MAG: DNA recombination protein RmuC [Alphaproteobacteria bacterium]|nr:DNA recombination protein RmuC [Alphaproteobacteria bacterium]|tara:strand:+ start:2921 stop:4048 length:1128 start_codon:yes stop_codon:yes gene_type:complete
MDILVLIAIVVGAVGVTALAATLLLRSRPDNSGDISALAERLSQMTEAQAAQQAQFAQTLQAQERALAKSVDDRLQHLTGRINETLEKTNKTQKTSLDELKERLVRIDTAQKNLTELSSQVVGLQEILSNKQARGAFGEVQLQDLVESAMPPDSYTFQATLKDGKRADCMLNLPNPPGPIVVDAKFPLEAWRQLQAAETDAEKKEAERAFRRDVAIHVKAIAEKYIVPGETADAALMFLPSESVYAELHANFGNSVDAAHRAKVFIVSPTTLWALLNTMRAVMKDVRMKEAAGIIQTEVLTMLQDVDRLNKRVGHLEKHFELAEKDIKDIRISADKVENRGKRIENIQLDGDDASSVEDAIEDTFDEPPLLRSVD